MKTLLPLLPLLLLAACGDVPPPQAAAPPPKALPPASPAGPERILGRTAAMLIQTFGEPDLDVREGPARKLQFSSGACVLDAYLSAPQPGREPIVRHVDTRLPNGDDIDTASCIAAMTRRSQAR